MDALGYVKVKGFVSNPLSRDKRVELDFLADTGVTTLELLGLQVDPTTGKLKPAELYLLAKL